MKEDTVLYSTSATVLAGLLFGLLLVFTWLGLRAGSLRKSYAATINDQSIAMTSLLSLQGLLLAFTFAMAGTRFEVRRSAIIDVAAALHTAIRRADLYPPAERAGFRQELHGFLEARIRYGQVSKDSRQQAAALAESNLYTHRLWNRVVRLSPDVRYQIANEQMIGALNNLFERALVRQATVRARVPDPIVYMLFIIALATAFFTGYINVTHRRFDWLTIAAFHFLVSLVVFITLSLDRPRRGLIQTSDVLEMLIALRQEFGSATDTLALPVPRPEPALPGAGRPNRP